MRQQQQANRDQEHFWLGSGWSFDFEVMACRKEHVLYCFDVLYSHLNGTEHADPLFANDE
jgi:hypothetical protein